MNKIKTNSLYYYANMYIKKPVDEEELERIDMTDVFYQELEESIKQGELISVNINGKVRLGKSTAGVSLGLDIFQLLIKYKYRKKGEKFSIKNIARDQQEYNRMMSDPEVQYTVIVTDEHNDLETGGENSSVEQQLADVFSKVQASRYVHRICCSPRDLVDSNADILLEVIGINKEERITHCRLYYRLLKAGAMHIQLLGYVNIEVGHIIKNWEERVKKHFYKKVRTRRDEEIINNWRKRDWYVEYVIKKQEKMELITKHGVFRTKSLEYAGVTLNVVNRLKDLAQIQSALTKGVVKNYVKMEARKQKVPQSIIGTELSTNEVLGVLDLHKSKIKVQKSMSIQQVRFRSGKLDHTVYKKIMKRLQDMVDEIEQAIRLQMEELEKYKKLKEEYEDFRTEEEDAREV